MSKTVFVSPSEFDKIIDNPDGVIVTAQNRRCIAMKMVGPAIGMTLEELKATAAKLGYSVVKKQPYVKLSACKCGDRRPQEWYCPTGIFYKCSTCELRSEPQPSQRRAKIAWNELVAEEATDEREKL